MPLPPLLWIVFFVCFLKFLLKVVLVRWCPHSVSMSRFSQFTVIWDAHVVSFVFQNVSFGMPVAPTLAP